MPSINIAKEDRHLELIYKEYARLKETTNTFIHSSFSDFRILAVIGLILAWDPIASSLNINKQNENIDLLFFGFLVILCIFAIIGTRDLIKQSFAIYYHKECKFLEAELNRLISKPERPIFHSSENWKTWYDDNHKSIGNWFYLLCFIVITFYPAYILYRAENSNLSLIYIIVSLILSTVANLLIRKLYHKNNFDIDQSI